MYIHYFISEFSHKFFCDSLKFLLFRILPALFHYFKFPFIESIIFNESSNSLKLPTNDGRFPLERHAEGPRLPVREDVRLGAAGGAGGGVCVDHQQLRHARCSKVTREG